LTEALDCIFSSSALSFFSVSSISCSPKHENQQRR